jgi:uncharacterized lipoprotein
MRSKIAAMLLTLALAGCAGSPEPPRQQATFISVVGTPLLIALKIPTCVGSIVIAAPLAAASQLAESSAIDESALRRDLDDGLIHNCGPPYAVAP